MFDARLVCPEIHQAKELGNRQVHALEECPRLQLPLLPAPGTAQGVADHRARTLYHRVLARAVSAPQLLLQKSCILQVLHERLVAVSDQCTELVDVHRRCSEDRRVDCR